MVYYILRCPNCKNTMKYKPRTKDFITNKTKRCVYCNHSFKIHPSLEKNRILKKKRES
ncbi:hypothetical protein JW949_03910 [Candidatus Woesearchaeota archaeon]|nr:hypothetical protein [Candidatus Woesearchaeota archaeon]